MYRFHSAAVAAAVIFLTACGGDSVSPAGNNNNPPPPPPPPAAAISAIELSPATAQVVVGQTRALVAKPRDVAGTELTGRPLTWTSSAGSIATVDANGIVTGVSAGTATISVQGEGKTANAAITVNAAGVPVATVTVSPALDTVEAYDPKTLTAVLRDAQNNVLTGRVVRWTSSNTAVATIDSVTGALLGIDRGTVTITATSEAKTGAVSRVIVIKYRGISSGSMHACDIASGGFVWCWGLNGREGRIGSATLGDSAMSTTPVLVPNTGWNALRFAQLSSYGNHTCGITVDAKAYCWGNNNWGQLGAGSNASQSNVPVLVAGNLSFAQVSAGADHSCGVTTDARAFCWGHNDWRQFASATPGLSTSPVQVAGGMTFTSITAGSGFTCAVATSAAGYCWGASGLGQLGDGSKISYGNTFSATPLAVASTSTLRTIEAGLSYACALASNGQALCWGGNGGRLGNGPTGTDSSTPVAVSGGQTFTSLSTGNGFSCAVATDAALWCWGSNDNGQLGVSAPFATSPVRSAGSLRVAEVSTSGVSTGYGRHTCTIAADRLTTYCFGRNETAQLGNGATTTATAVNSTPTIVVGQKPL
jgi:alpha-tubulin suppressor-like RCC1 family protein